MDAFGASLTPALACRVSRVRTRLTTAALALAVAAGACGTDRAPSVTEKLSTISTLRVAITDPGSLDPATVGTRSGLLVLKQLCDTLVAVDQGTGTLKPGLAESWSFNDNATQITFNIRRGVKFHNGREVSAADFVYSLNRLADPTTNSPNHHLVERVTGYLEMRSGSAPTLSGVRALDPNKLQIDLREPFAELPAVLSHVAAGAAVPQEEVERAPDAFAAAPVCTGPYRPAPEPPAEGKAELVRFDDYHGANGAFSIGGKGYAKRITFQMVTSLEESFLLLDEGEVDLAQVSNGDLGRAQEAEYRVESRENGHVAYLGFPLSATPYDTADIRRKLAATVDRSEIVDELLGGTRVLSDSVLPGPAGPVAQQASCPELGAEATEGSPVESLTKDMNIYLNTGGGHESWLESVVDDWEGLGAKGLLKPMDWEAYIEYLTAPGADGPFRMSWAVSYPSPEAMLAPLFAAGSPNNFTRFANPEFDAHLAQARTTLDDTQRAEAYADAAKLICRQMPILPVWFGLSHLAFAPQVVSAVEQRLDVSGDPILRELSIS